MRPSRRVHNSSGSHQPPLHAIWRIIDANGNRAVEGLRVLEDCARFLFADASLSERCKQTRHRLRALIPPKALIGRDTAGDVGCAISTVTEARRPDLATIICANARRAEEALRTIEEWAKLVGLDASEAEALRYASYDIERDCLTRLPAARLAREKLYVLVDVTLCEEPLRVAAAAVRGGAGIVQLRAKQLNPRAYLALARSMQEVVRAAGGLFIVNDHVAIAAALAADGIHVGQDDLPPATVRAVVGPLMAIGLSTHSPQQIAAARAEGADHIGVGPMFATDTKPQETVRGPALLAAVPADLPSYAIGGLDPARVAALRPRLPHGIAIAGAVCTAADPAACCAALRQILDNDAP